MATTATVARCDFRINDICDIEDGRRDPVWKYLQSAICCKIFDLILSPERCQSIWTYYGGQVAATSSQSD
jgi:hypothetical protein